MDHIITAAWRDRGNLHHHRHHASTRLSSFQYPPSSVAKCAGTQIGIEFQRVFVYLRYKWRCTLTRSYFANLTDWRFTACNTFSSFFYIKLTRNETLSLLPKRSPLYISPFLIDQALGEFPARVQPLGRRGRRGQRSRWRSLRRCYRRRRCRRRRRLRQPPLKNALGAHERRLKVWHRRRRVLRLAVLLNLEGY